MRECSEAKFWVALSLYHWISGKIDFLYSLIDNYFPVLKFSSFTNAIFVK